jgi:hypothetical protein
MPGYVRARGKRKDGSTIWQARWRPEDDPGDRNREERSFKTKRDAERWIKRRDADVERGTYAPARRGEVAFTTVLADVRAKWNMKVGAADAGELRGDLQQVAHRSCRPASPWPAVSLRSREARRRHDQDGPGVRERGLGGSRAQHRPPYLRRPQGGLGRGGALGLHRRQPVRLRRDAVQEAPGRPPGEALLGGSRAARARRRPPRPLALAEAAGRFVRASGRGGLGAAAPRRGPAPPPS